MRPESLEQFVRQRRSAFEEAGPGPNLWHRISDQLDGGPALESFVDRHRDEFDVDEPPTSLWASIEGQLAPVTDSSSLNVQTQGKVRRLRTWYRMSAAAAVALLVAAAFLLGRSSGYESGQTDYMALIEQVQPDFADTEAHFQSEISERFELVNQYNDDPQLEVDLAEIDQAMAEIKTELAIVPLDERAELVAQLIESYRLKLHILERILKHLPVSETSPETFNNNETNEI